MSLTPPDYSKLVDAILADDRKAADELSSELLKRVKLYLKVRMGAPESIAEECAYQAFSDVFEIIRNEKIRDSKSIFKYFITASRHEYLRYKKNELRVGPDPSEKEEAFPNPAEQLDNLIDEERKDLLNKCMDQLSDDNRRFILTFFSSKKINLLEIAEKFRFSYAKTRTLKTRIMQKLRECVQKEQ